MNDTIELAPEALVDNSLVNNSNNSTTENEQLDSASLKQGIMDSLKSTFSAEWAEVHQFAEQEAEQLSQMLMKIHALKISGETTEKRAKFLFNIQRNTQKSYLLAVRGLGKAAVDSAIQDAFNHVRKRFNQAIGFDLL